jgi:hypothetical protein
MPPRSALPQRTLEELIAIHRVETTVHDVIVEGTSDKNLVEWFLLENDKRNFAVYEVGLFEVDPNEVLALGLQDNNRGRVIAAAINLAKHCGEKARVSCIADRDFDKVLEVEWECDLLLLTDYTCMLMYAFNLKVLRKYFRFRVRGFGKSASRAILEISEALETLFAVKLANQILALGLKPVKWQDCCSLEINGVDLDVEEYLKRYLNKNARRSEMARLVDQIQECRSWMKFDPRFHIKGHDFIAILIWYISQHPGFGAFARRTEDIVEDELFSCVELKDLLSEDLFQELLVRIED